MLTEAGCRSRRARLWDAVPDELSWLLIADPRHVQYLSNFMVQPLSFSGGERGWLLLERDGPAALLGDNFTLRSAASEPFVDAEVVEVWYDHKHSVVNRDHALLAALRRASEGLAGRPGAVEAEWLPTAAMGILGQGVRREVATGTDLRADLGSIIRQLRRQKEPDEIDLLKRCMRAGDAGHGRAREIIAAGMGELDVYREVQSAALAALGEPGLVYGDFRAVNANEPKAGGLPSNHRLKDGDLFILDYSVVLGGYRSDFTNTISVGEPSDEVQHLFAVCQQAMRAGEETLKAGVRAADVYAAVSAPLEAAGHGPLPHHAGHGIGLAHPEPPILVPSSTDELVPGDVVTLEPGAYVAGIGGMRIEHNYLVTHDGNDRLSNHVISLV